MADGNQEFPVPFAHFAAAIRATSDEVFTLLMQRRYQRENHTMTEWRQLLDAVRHEPAHPGF